MSRGGRLWRLSLGLGVAVGLGGVALAQPVPASTIAAGRAIAQRDCGGCHAAGPTGRSPLAPAPAFRDLHQRYDVANLAEALAEGILVGHAPMPVRAYPPGEIDALIAYLKSLEPARP